MLHGLFGRTEPGCVSDAFVRLWNLNRIVENQKLS